MEQLSSQERTARPTSVTLLVLIAALLAVDAQRHITQSQGERGLASMQIGDSGDALKRFLMGFSLRSSRILQMLDALVRSTLCLGCVTGTKTLQLRCAG